MENYKIHLQCQSQDYLLSTLSMQIDAMTPIKISYNNLQHYHLKISHDFQSMLQQHKEISSITSSKLKQQISTLNQLEQQKTSLIEQIRKIENEQAKLTLEKKNLSSLNEGLICKIELQKQQQLNLINRKRQLEEAHIKLSMNIRTAQNLNKDILRQIYDKKNKLDQLQSEINCREKTNKKILMNNELFDKDLKKINSQNNNLADKNRDLDLKLIALQKNCEEVSKVNWNINQNNIQKGQQLKSIYNENQYFLRMLRNEENANTSLKTNQNQLESLINAQNNQLNNVNIQNNKISRQINQQIQKIAQNRRYKDAVIMHMQNLIEMNNLIVNKMEQWCNEDRGVIKIIQSKVHNLSLAVQKNRGIMIQRDVNAYTTNMKDKKEVTAQSWTTTSSFLRKQH